MLFIICYCYLFVCFLFDVVVDDDTGIIIAFCYCNLLLFVVDFVFVAFIIIVVVFCCCYCCYLLFIICYLLFFYFV